MLKYLFTAIYKNGATYQQTQEDKSIKEPETRSSYYDVDHDQLVGFVLKGEGNEYAVDLRDGHFEVNGVPFFMHEVQNPDVPAMEQAGGVKLRNFRLIYFRENTRTFTAEVMNNQMNNPQETGLKTVYRMGWQAEDAKGKNYQQIMQIN